MASIIHAIKLWFSHHHDQPPIVQEEDPDFDPELYKVLRDALFAPKK